MRVRRALGVLLAAATAIDAAAINIGGQRLSVRSEAVGDAQSLVTFDPYSLMVKGERVLFYSGSFHPFRLPVPGLWLDIFQKIKALGYNGVTFYIDWALLEGTQGVIRDSGIFSLDPFFSAAKEAGIYLIARPGPYINAEASGGGFPGWLKRNPATLRTDQPGYLNATDLYMSKIGAVIAANQITKGGPVILVQPENEYSTGSDWPEPAYFGYVQQQLRNAGITVPLISNDAYPGGNFAPGTQDAIEGIYGYDGYPLGFNCGNPSNWGTNSLPTDYGSDHYQQSPSTPNSIVEFQGGSFDPWGGVGFNNCVALTGSDFENVFYKNDFSFKTAIFNLYMTYGGSNWGNLGHPGGYSSYDYGAAIAENRLVDRAKYSEAKLIANGLRSLRSYLTAYPQSNNNAAGAFTGNNNVFVTQLTNNGTNPTNFYVARQSEYYSTNTVNYYLKVQTSQGNVTIPQLGGQLSLQGRDSKMTVTDYDLNGLNLVYSSAEIFTYQKYGKQRVLVLYGNPGEQHEFAVKGAGKTVFQQGKSTISTKKGMTIVNMKLSNTRNVLKFSKGLLVYVLPRPLAYGFWVIDPSPSATTPSLPIVNMPNGYLVRKVSVSGGTVEVTGDLNATTSIEVIGAGSASSITFNGKKLTTTKEAGTGALMANLPFNPPSVNIPDLLTIGWKSIDGLPEIQNSYDDSKWPKAFLTYTNNTERPDLNTPTSLYAADYFFNTGSLLYRGHFTSTGNETNIQISPQGGYAFGYSLWLNDTFLGSYAGNANNYYYYGHFPFNKTLTKGEDYVFTVLIDHMGNNENYDPGYDYMKEPRGVMQYEFDGRPLDAITWKLTGNLGGENYYDIARGPLNEGGMWAERHGYHLPDPPTKNWKNSKGPSEGMTEAGVTFYSTTFDLNLPEGYDIPISLDFGADALTGSSNYRCLVFVNGYQFGKFVSNIGPQYNYPVPQGIWNYQGSNTVAISLWALDANGTTGPQLQLSAAPISSTGYGSFPNAPAPKWKKRKGVY